MSLSPELENERKKTKRKRITTRAAGMKISLVQTCCLMVVYLPVALSMTLNSKIDPSSAGDLLGDSNVDVYKRSLSNKIQRLFTESSKAETENMILKILKIMEENRKAEAAESNGVYGRELHMKRLKPSFNPTGWRRKRDVNWDAVLVDALGGATGEYNNRLPEGEKEQWRKRTMSNGSSGSYSSSGSYASSRKRFIDRSSKRKPLQFNPTGW